MGACLKRLPSRPRSPTGSPAAAGACAAIRRRCSRRATPGATRCWSPIPARARRSPDSCRRWPTSRPPGWPGARRRRGCTRSTSRRSRRSPTTCSATSMAPIEEIGLPIRVETRSGDTPRDRKRRQRARPPHVLLTTPEIALAAAELPGQLRAVRRAEAGGDRRSPCLRHRQARRLAGAGAQPAAGDRAGDAARGAVGDGRLSRALSRMAGAVGRDRCVELVAGEKGAPPEVEILLPEEASVPWGGHAALWAIPQLYEMIKRNKTTLIFTNTRFLAELIFSAAVGRERGHAADRHPPRLAQPRRRGARSKGRWRGASCARWSPPPASTSGSTGATSIAWCRWGRRRAQRACCSASGGPTTGSIRRAGAILVPGNRFEFLEAQAAKDAVDQGQRDGEDFARAGSTCSRST